MNWTDLLKREIEDTYKAADGLMAMVDSKGLGWKPPTGTNWMTTGQLLRHMTEACGACCRMFVTGEWPEMSPEDMLPSAEKMPSAASVKEARDLLAKDRNVALASVVEAGEKDLAGKQLPAPWDPTPQILGRQLLHMVGHLGTHKAQLFYYLKLQGKPVNTMNLYGG
jgi:hypothetical protein